MSTFPLKLDIHPERLLCSIEISSQFEQQIEPSIVKLSLSSFLNRKHLYIFVGNEIAYECRH